MPATIAFLGTMLNGADSTTSWVGGASLDTASKIHGTGCLGIKQTTGTGNVFLYNFSSGVDFTTGDKHFYIWGLVGVASTLETRANGGVRIRLGTGTANYYDWYMDGRDTYTGGWKKYVIDPLSDPDGSLSPPANLSAITFMGLTFNCASQFSGNNLTIFVDAIHIGTGLRITGTSTTDAGFEDVYQDDIVSTNRYGLIDKVGGVYFLKGELVFGNASSATNPDFSDSGSTVVFEDQRVSSTLYKIDVVGNSGDTTTNSFRLGTAIGSAESTIGSKGVTISATGSATSTGSYQYVSGTPATITRSSGNFKIDGLKGGMFLQITGTTNNNKNVVSSKVAAQTITLVTGETLTNEGPVSSTITGSRRFNFSVTDTNVKTLKFYGSTIRQAGTISLGSSATAISPTTIELVDTTFSNTRQVVRNVTTASPLYLRNSVNFNTNLAASMDLYDAKDTASGRWKILQGPGFRSTAGGAQTILLSDHDFTIATKPYITLETNETWNANDHTWTIVNQNELNFGGGTLSGASVNSRITVNVTAQTPAGAKLQNVRAKIVEADDGTGNPQIANSGDTNSNGLVSFNYLRRKYEGAASNGLTITTHATQSLKAYKYGKFGFFSSIDPVDTKRSETAALTDDTFQVESNEATAVSDGTQKVVFVESTTLAQSHSIIKYTSGTGTLDVGNTVTGGSSGAQGVVEEIIEGNSAAGTVILKSRTSTSYSGTESLTESGSSTDWSATLTLASEKRFYWLIQAGTIGGTKRTLQQLYDHFQAKLAEATLDTADNWHKVVIDGRAEYANPIQGVSLGSPNEFKTIRNAALTRGWVISGLNSFAGLNAYTANDGTTYVPALAVILTINGVSQNTRCYIEATSGGPETAGTILMLTTADSTGTATTTYTYTGDQPVKVRARLVGYLPFETLGTIKDTGLTVTAVWQADTISDKVAS